MDRIDPPRTALLVMDLQTEILPGFGAAAAPLLQRAAGVIAAARAAKLPVIYVVVGFRPGYPEANPKNPLFGPIVQGGRLIITNPADAVAAPVKPEPHDVLVVKHRVSAFFGTDLDLVLRAKGIETLVLLGVATSGVVLSTVRHGGDADYKLVVVKDCCADRDDEVHRVLVEKVFPRQASVVTADELQAALA